MTAAAPGRAADSQVYRIVPGPRPRVIGVRHHFLAISRVRHYFLPLPGARHWPGAVEAAEVVSDPTYSRLDWRRHANHGGG